MGNKWIGWASSFFFSSGFLKAMSNEFCITNYRAGIFSKIIFIHIICFIFFVSIGLEMWDWLITLLMDWFLFTAKIDNKRHEMNLWLIIAVAFTKDTKTSMAINKCQEDWQSKISKSQADRMKNTFWVSADKISIKIQYLEVH